MPRPPPAAADRAALVRQIEAALSDPATYERKADDLPALIYALARTQPPASLWERLAARPVPEMTLSLIGGATTPTAREVVDWLLLWGMTRGGRGSVPPDWLELPWSGETNRAEKYYVTAPLAIWAAGRLGQADRATIDALIGRLDRDDDPLWLRGDVVGALTALTGRRFGYDVGAWQAWWAERAD